uniref:Peptidase S1 domain-containing protein n=1 Tax=Steinernema glaseri TaxID=37863 RepID=A0A1I8AUD5_9BILA
MGVMDVFWDVLRRELFSTDAQSVQNIFYRCVHKDFTFSRAVKTVQLRYDDSKILDSVKTLTATGWGVYDPHDDTKTSTTLREVQVPLIPHNTCKKWWNLHVANSDVDDSMICAGGIGKGTGQGDSGGPLLAFYNNTYIQVGLTSFGVNSPEGLYDQYDFPAVYTRVSKYCDFISKATGKMATCGANGTMYFFAIITAIASYALLH